MGEAAGSAFASSEIIPMRTGDFLHSRSTERATVA